MIAAVIDSCVIFGMPVCDTLLRCAEVDLYRIVLSDRILDDATRNMVAKGRLKSDREDYYKQQIKSCFPAAFVTALPTLIDRMTNEPQDRHVLAAAIIGSAKYVVTFNLKDFLDADLEPHGAIAIHPNDFLELLCDYWGDARLYRMIGEQSQALQNPPISAQILLDKLARQKCGSFRSRMLKYAATLD